MSSLSEQAQQVVQELIELEQRRTILNSRRTNLKVESSIRVLGRLNNLALVHYLVPYLSSNSSQIRRATVEAIEHLVADNNSIALPSIGHVISDPYGTSYHYSSSIEQWTKVTPSNVRYLAATANRELSGPVLGVLSFHRSGYVRQEAVRLLATLQTGAELPFLLIRQNDWVEQIRVIAREAIDHRLNESYLPHLLQHVDLIGRLPSWSRVDHSSAYDQFLELITASDQRHWLRQVFTKAAKPTQRTMLRSVLASSDASAAYAAGKSLDSEDPVLRLWATKWLLSKQDQHAIERGLQDHFAPIRREAYLADAQLHPTRSETIWEKALFDASFSIRELARYHLRDSGVEAASRYRDALTKDPEVAIALAGLSECCDSADGERLARYLSHPYASRRRLAIRGLSKHDRLLESYDLSRFLADPSPCVVRETRKALSKSNIPLSPRHLHALLQSCQTDYGQKAILNLMYSISSWSSLPWLIRCVAMENTVVSETAKSHIADIFYGNRVWTKPTAQESEMILAAFIESHDKLTQKCREDLQACLPFLTN